MNTHSRITHWLVLPLLAGLLAGGCKRGGGHDGHDHGAHEEDAHAKEAGGADAHAGHGEDAHGAPGAEEHAEGEEVVHMTADTMTKAGIRLEPAGPRTIDETITLRGEVGLNADAVAHVTVRAPGVVRDVQAHVGQQVKEGALLATLDSPALGEAKIAFLDATRDAEIADADLARDQTIHANTAKLLTLLADEPEYDALEAQLNGLSIGASRGSLLTGYAELRRARADFERTKSLHEGDRPIVSKAAFLAARSAFESARASYSATYESVSFSQATRLLTAERATLIAHAGVRNAERRLHVLGLTEAQVAGLPGETPQQVARYELRAPITGTVIAKHITRGEGVSAADTLFVIADLSTVWIDLAVYPGDLHRVQRGQAVQLDCMGVQARCLSEVAFVTPTAAEQTRSATARCIVANDTGHLRPGLTVNGHVSVAKGDVAVAVQMSAVQQIEGRDAVFVQVEPGKFEARPVALGRTDGVWIEIRSGLQAGENVAVGETFILKAEQGKSQAGHDHAH